MIAGSTIATSVCFALDYITAANPTFDARSALFFTKFERLGNLAHSLFRDERIEFASSLLEDIKSGPADDCDDEDEEYWNKCRTKAATTTLAGHHIDIEGESGPLNVLAIAK